MNREKSCIHCKYLEVCPIIKLWLELTEQPIEALNFFCSEYIEQEMPK